MLCTADAARILGKTAEAGELTQEAALYRAAIDAALEAYRPWPISAPSWEGGGHALGQYRNPLADRDLRTPGPARWGADQACAGRVRWWLRGRDHPLARRCERHPSLHGGRTPRWRTWSGARDEQVVEDFYWYLLHSTAAHAFPEGIYFKRRFAWSDTIPHVTGACNYALMLPPYAGPRRRGGTPPAEGRA